MSPQDDQEKRLQVALFSGGRGTGSITDALLKHPDIELTLLVNTYDDGLSTGLLRRLIPGMLGPSDVRKNISRFLQHSKDSQSQALLFLVEYRFPTEFTKESALELLRQFVGWNSVPYQHELIMAREKLSVSQMREASDYISAFLNHYTALGEPSWFTFSDVSFGNLFFAGCYLLHDKDFNKTIIAFSDFARLGHHVLNITNGENRVLMGMKKNGIFLQDEASVVGPQDNSLIGEIFLLPRYLRADEITTHSETTDMVRFLHEHEQLPFLQPAAREALEKADIIIYGPGTQYSSLFPSYLTIGVAEAIQANTHAEKIFIANIARDYDILGEDATTLVKGFLANMSRKNTVSVNCQQLVSRFFFQKPETSDREGTPYVPFDAKEFEYPLEQVTWLDWEGEAGKHSGSRTVAELLTVVEKKLEKRIRHISQKISIIVPALNEERTIANVLGDLTNLQFPDMDLEKEIIFVDGGSSDRTFDIAMSIPNVRTYVVSGVSGKGKALRLGMEKAKGDILVFFPADGEYVVGDISRVIRPLLQQEFPVVFGSRAFRSTDLTGTLRRIYGTRGFSYFTSKYGGIALSVVTLLMYNRFISDPLTSIKGFNARIFRDMRFISNGFDFDIELIAKIARSGHVILEVPVSYTARTVEQGKKITLWDGVACLLTLFQFSRWKAPYAKSIHRHSSV